MRGFRDAPRHTQHGAHGRLAHNAPNTLLNSCFRQNLIQCVCLCTPMRPTAKSVGHSKRAAGSRPPVPHLQRAMRWEVSKRAAIRLDPQHATIELGPPEHAAAMQPGHLCQGSSCTTVGSVAEVKRVRAERPCCVKRHRGGQIVSQVSLHACRDHVCMARMHDPRAASRRIQWMGGSCCEAWRCSQMPSAGGWHDHALAQTR